MTGFFSGQPSSEEIRDEVRGFQSWLEVDLDAIGHNLEEVRRKTGVEVVPCVKTDGYGHGIVPVAAYLTERGVERVLVAKLHEALRIREAGLTCGIISMDPLYTMKQFKTVVEEDITHTVYQMRAAEMLSQAAHELGGEANIWVKVDTGLGRVGVRQMDAPDLIEDVVGLPGLRLEGIFSTLSEDDELDRRQVERLLQVEEELRRRGIDPGTRSIASSNAVFHKPYAYLDAFRPGLMLMGLYPEPGDRGKGIELRQALSLKARLEHVKTVQEGEPLTYSSRFTAPGRMRVGTVHVGYSDGYPRGLTGKGVVRVKGREKQVLGTVSINHFLVDLDGVDAEAGDVVEAIGRSGSNSGERVAESAGIMTYKLCVGLNPLTPRVYMEDGEPVALSKPELVESRYPRFKSENA
ncbi:MAG: alanine racemase [Candidatus Bathyarchaeia archaeon]